MDPGNNELEDGQRQARLQKWLPLLWLAPVALILLLALIAYVAR